MRTSKFVGMTILGLMMSLTVGVVFAQGNLFDQSFDTNGGANRFWVTEDCTYQLSGQAVGGQPAFDSIGPWLNEAALVYGGSVVSLGNLSGTGVPNSIEAQSNGIAKISGSNVGGQFRWQFNSQAEAQNFINFVIAVRNDDSNLFLTNCGLPQPTDFDQSFDTNGGANRFFIEGGQFKVSGQSVSGRFETTDVIAWVNEAARLYDCSVVRSGSFNYSTTPNIRRAQDNGRAVLGGQGVGGSFVWQCGGLGQAQNFVNFLNVIANEGLFEIDL